MIKMIIEFFKMLNVWQFVGFISGLFSLCCFIYYYYRTHKKLPKWKRNLLIQKRDKEMQREFIKKHCQERQERRIRDRRKKNNTGTDSHGCYVVRRESIQ